eukprot:TRINITY_DN4904_c0_g1_i2.p1 TRINITY_DN4904_c0_g1~~TRINITY_DN4904_c0_g1_i2.p1  ORF type:complete len:153 (+),score=17.19 TRINITY_DN4904_c0_g1_i2:50-508(+)
MEHSLLYQYSFLNAKNVMMGMIQTETPYFQPSTHTPFNPEKSAGDPSYCTNDDRCRMAWALVLDDVDNVFVYGTGLYSFFDIWEQSCLKTSGGPSCQLDIVSIVSTTKSALSVYSLNTYGSIYMLDSSAKFTAANSNSDTFCSNAIVNLDLW